MKLLLFSLLIVSMFMLNACAGNADVHHDHSTMDSSAKSQADSHAGRKLGQHGEMTFTSRQHAVTQASQNGLYKISLFCNESPIPLQKIHSWTLHVEDVDGKPVDDLKVFVSGGMPMHRHGFPTKPRVSDHRGNGDYSVDGIKFNMAGHWEMRFNFKEKGGSVATKQKDRVIFKIHLK